MNLQQLYYFQAISRLKNYTKAAEQLLVAQSSLSHSIGDLERELGVPLFFKVGRNIDITEYGKQFLIHVDRITAELELANQELKKMGAPVRLQPGRNEITEAEQQAKPQHGQDPHCPGLHREQPLYPQYDQGLLRK